MVESCLWLKSVYGGLLPMVETLWWIISYGGNLFYGGLLSTVKTFL